MAEARKLHHSVGTEHLLLGLLQVPDGYRPPHPAALRGHRHDPGPTLALIDEATPAEAAEPLPKSNVVMCRLDGDDLNALDTLIEAGVRTTRSDAAAWLIRAGIQANGQLFDSVRDKVAQIRQLREEARGLANQTLTP